MIARLTGLTLVSAGALLASSAAIAGVVPVPAPVLGAGAPALALFAAGYYLIRKRRRS